MKILICEDDPISATILTIVLKEEGYLVNLAKDGKEAIDFLNDNRYDLIITDARMPHMSGMELIEHVRNVLKLNTHVMVLTAMMETTMKKEFLDAGANDYIIKPFETAELLKKIKLIKKT